MKKNKLTKLALALGTIGTIAAPVAAVVSCGSTEVDPEKNIILQVEKSWMPTYTKIVNDFKADPVNAKAMKDAGIDNVVLKEMGSFDVETQFNNKGLRDASTPDIFLMAVDKIDWFRQSKFLKAFKETSATDYASTRHFAFDPATQVSQDAATVGGALYGVPENVEAMVKMGKATGATKGAISRFSDLWFSNGYFNTASFNLRDVLKTDANGKVDSIFNNDAFTNDTVKDKTSAFAAIKTGFVNVLTAAEPITDITAVDKDSAVAAPVVDGMVKDGYQVYAGPWDKETITKAAGGAIKAEKVADSDHWNQWGGGWSYGMNARVSDAKRDIMENLIAQFYNKQYAEEMFTVAGKASPTVEGRNVITDSKFDNAQANIPSALYDTKVMPKPLDSGFGVIWTDYSNLMGKNKQAIVDLDKDKSTDITGDIDKLATTLAAAFEADAATAITKTNTTNGK